MTTEEKRQLAFCSASPEKLAKLSGDADYYVRWNVANNPNTSTKILAKLSEDMAGDVRRRVAKNPNASNYVIEKVSRDADYYVRYFVAQNPSTAIEVLEWLSRDEKESIRVHTIQQPKNVRIREMMKVGRASTLDTCDQWVIVKLNMVYLRNWEGRLFEIGRGR